ncbi:unnamed protein product [Trifolium pratense]|uniref:Uncharacterized protein n=1 Tax=Trifolium pratense TaxID=57577 RepID=A0ACB0KC76_TRIPR|nr:unnamed protein product [Trifolium pratense]
MKNNWFFDSNCNGVSDEILEDVVDFFDFPDEDVETDDGEHDWNDKFKHLEEPSLGIFSVSSTELHGKTKPVNNFAAAELSHIDRRNIVNPSLKGQQALLRKAARPAYTKTLPIQMVSFNGTNLRKCQTYSPVSVFESSSYSSVENFNFELPVIPAKRPRSKRQRLSSFDKLFTIPFISTPPAFQKYQLAKQCAGKSSSKVQRKLGKKDISSLSDGIEMKRSALQDSATPTKCMHCEVTETPQWREGPKGPRTLCNACGVRYRSGRLFPEYRPAASPTFEASLHSNSHKKVLEIRNKDNANMKSNWFFDNNFNGVSDEILEDVVEFFDFPHEDVETDAVEHDLNDQFKHLEEPSLGIFSVPSSELYGETQNEKPNSINNFAAAELSHIDRRNNVNASLKDQQALAATKTMVIQMVSFNGTNLRKCQTYSPVSVFESSSYSSVENFNFELPVIPAKRPRNKLQRLSSAFLKHQLEKQCAGKSSSKVQRKPSKKDISSLSDGIEMKRSALQDSATPTKCMHCEVTETPQWREGPKGSRTLCNACGVRYRSGRLFPEYRPAASPTFEASLHSNSHKKVLEIRNKVS